MEPLQLGKVLFDQMNREQNLQISQDDFLHVAVVDSTFYDIIEQSKDHSRGTYNPLLRPSLSGMSLTSRDSESLVAMSAAASARPSLSDLSAHAHRDSPRIPSPVPEATSPAPAILRKERWTPPADYYTPPGSLTPQSATVPKDPTPSPPPPTDNGFGAYLARDPEWQSPLVRVAVPAVPAVCLVRMGPCTPRLQRHPGFVA